MPLIKEMISAMDFNKELSERVGYVNDILLKYLPPAEGLQKTVIDAMHYSVMSGGKRIRAILMSETYKMFGGKDEVIEPFIAAMEMIQAYSLVHDDLPALDNDEYRRGIKSTHAMFGEAMGILAGDALLNYAFETAFKAFSIKPSASEQIAGALGIFGRKAGLYGMIGGQVVDVETEDKTIPLETLDFIHHKKCGALIEASMMIGAVLAGADKEEVTVIEAIAADVGFAFQIRDDILDVTGTTETLGKPAGSDDKNGKNTYVKYLGIKKAEEKVDSVSNRALLKLMSLPYDSVFLSELIKSMINRVK